MRTNVAAVIGDTQGGKKQQAYKTEIIGGVVVHTPIQVITMSSVCMIDNFNICNINIINIR